MKKHRFRYTNTFYVLILAVFVVGCLIAVTAISVYNPDQDNTAIITQIFGFMTTVSVAMLAFIKANEGVSIMHEAKDVTHETKAIAIEAKAAQVHTGQMMDGRITDLMEAVKKLAMAQGIQLGIDKGILQESMRAGDVEKGRAEGVQAGIQQEVDRAEVADLILEGDKSGSSAARAEDTEGGKSENRSA